MSDLLIVYHSQSGANQQLARAAYDASRTTDYSVTVRRASDAEVGDVLQSKALLLCFAETNASIAGGMKEFLDRIYYPVCDSEIVLPLAVAISVGSDGSNALRLFKRIATGMRCKWVAEPLIINGEPDLQACEQVGELALAMLEGVALGIF